MKYKVGDKVLLQGEVFKIEKGNIPYPYGIRIAKNVEFMFGEEEMISKTYSDGLADAWELARQIVLDNGMDCDTFMNIFGTYSGYDEVLRTMTPQEALAKIEAYEKSQQIEVGDVIVTDDGIKCVAIDFTSDNDVIVLNENGCAEAHLKSVFKKTGRHIDIEHLLEQIRGNE